MSKRASTRSAKPSKKNWHSLKRMSVAVASDNGLGIMFAFETHKGKILECECTPAAVPEIVAKLLGATEQAAKNARATKVDLSYGIHADRYALGGSERGEPALMLHFFPSANCPIGFHLSLEVAEKLAADLPNAIATIRNGLPARH